MSTPVVNYLGLMRRELGYPTGSKPSVFDPPLIPKKVDPQKAVINKSSIEQQCYVVTKVSNPRNKQKAEDAKKELLEVSMNADRIKFDALSKFYGPNHLKNELKHSFKRVIHTGTRFGLTKNQIIEGIVLRANEMSLNDSEYSKYVEEQTKFLENIFEDHLRRIVKPKISELCDRILFWE
jgi:hypothetical protein